MTMNRNELLETFVAGLRTDGYAEYYVRPQPPNRDSDWHSADWHGRFLMLRGTVTLEISGRTFVMGAGESYEVPPDTTHREVFGAEGAELVIARRSVGKPLPALMNVTDLISLR